MGLRPKPRAGRPPAYGVSAAGGWFWLVVAGRPQYWISGFGWLALALRPKCRRIVNIQVGRIKASQWATPEHHNHCAPPPWHRGGSAEGTTSVRPKPTPGGTLRILCSRVNVVPTDQRVYSSCSVVS